MSDSWFTFSLIENILNRFYPFYEKASVEDRISNLRLWNTKQFALWLSLCAESHLDSNNTTLFGNFGAWFYSFVDRNQDYPTETDAIEWIQSI